jgi:putative sensory transduction regulator
MDNVVRAQEALQRVLVEIDWASPQGSAAASHRIVFGRGAPVSDVILGIDRPSQLFLLLANLARTDDDARRPESPGSVNRANWDLMLGNFEMDEESGAVRYRCGVHFGDGELGDEAIRRTIVTAMGLVEAHAPALARGVAQ